MNIVLLAAGRGSRLSELTDSTHKSLLPLAGRPALAYLFDEIMQSQANEVVLVTGYRHEDVASFSAGYGARVRVVHNDRWTEDTNIWSAKLGVDALSSAASGYHIIETDIVMEPRGWRRLLGWTGEHSAWSTRGVYSQQLTGGILLPDASGRVREIAYVPAYDPAYDGWAKLLGTLYVGPRQVDADRRLRAEAAELSIAQYYMRPWVEQIAQLPCRQLDLSDCFAISYNDMGAYRRADWEFRSVLDVSKGQE